MGRVIKMRVPADTGNGRGRPAVSSLELSSTQAVFNGIKPVIISTNCPAQGPSQIEAEISNLRLCHTHLPEL